MRSGFWKNLTRPIFALAPMANVTDCAFRAIIAKYSKFDGANIFDEQGKFTRRSSSEASVGGPDVMFTEFTSCDGLQSPGRAKLLIDFKFSEAERPIVAQIFGSKPDNFYKTALLIQELGFDGIDINMGCPDRNVEKQGAGAKLMQNPKLAAEIIAATKRGAGQLPISVKTRVGFNKVEMDTWLPYLLEMDLAAIIIHARTRKEMSKVPARWEHVKRAVEIRDDFFGNFSRGGVTPPLRDQTLILGNGDVLDINDAKNKITETSADGVMIGRGIFGNPWLFRDCHSDVAGGISVSPIDGQRSLVGREASLGMTVGTKQKLFVMVEHTKLFERLLSEHKNFDIMKKHYKAYVNGFPGAKELRVELMENAKSAEDVERIVKQFIKTI
ncbi:MAG: tRNA-dihydrouridine synthase [Candidatus Magasanikbacteria bacterium]|nr:tRNA-dihydrouridine synthase [Candidatus Magasanikbacteria bacterium]